MLALGGACTKAGGLSSLLSFTSTIYCETLTDAWINGIELLLKKSPIEVFQSYIMPNWYSNRALADIFCVGVVNQHRDRLVRFSFHRQCISLGTVKHVCISCPGLEELFVAIQYTEMVHFLFFFRNLFTEG